MFALVLRRLVAGCVVAGFLGHQTAHAQIQLPGIVIEAPSPIVQPAAAPTSPAESPGTIIATEDTFVPVTVITADQIERYGGATLADALQWKPGIAGTTFAPGANRPVIRGLDSYRIRTQENGIGTHDVANLSEDHAVPIDPFAAERLEVVRGPATLRYGSQAIGGVVSASNGRIPELMPRQGFAARIAGGLSSVDDGRDGGISVTAGAGNFVAHADAFERHIDDYTTPHGRQLNTFVDSDGFAVGGSFVGRDGFVGVSVSRFASLYGIPGEEAAEARPRIDLEQVKVLSKGEWRLRDHGIDAIRFWFGASDYAHNEVVFEESEGADAIGSRFTNREQEGRIEVQHLPIATGLGQLTGAAGVQIDHRKTVGDSFEGDDLLAPARTRSIAAFWFEELEMTSAFRLQAAARIEQSEVAGIGLLDFSDPLAPVTFDGERTFRPVSASLGMLYDLPRGITARLTGQYTERAPEAGELYSKGVHEATETFEIGNPNLAKERAATVEFGLARARGDLRFDASAYYTRFDGFIYRQLTGLKCEDTLDTCADDPSLELDQVLFQQRDATFYGVEIAAQYDVAPIWRGVWGIEGQYDFVRARFEDGENVPRIPPHRLGGGLFYRDSAWLARIGMLHAFRQDEIGFNETQTSGYTLLNAELSYTTTLERNGSVVPELTIGLRGENLLDDDVRNHASFKKDDVLLPGASVRLFGTIRLN
jgi:iron complex outermembrane receptor protein